MGLVRKRFSNVVRIRRGGPESKDQALDRLYTEHVGALRAFLSVRLRVVVDLDDLVQEVFMRLARMDDLLDKLPPTNDSARSFIFAVANRLVIDAERRRKVRWRYSEQSLSGGDAGSSLSPSAETTILAREDLDHVKKTICELKPEWRTAFVLSRLRCMSYKEISKLMNVSQKTVEKYIHCSLIQIRSAIDVGKE